MRVVTRRSDSGTTAWAAERPTRVVAAEEQQTARSRARSHLAGVGQREQLDSALGDLGQGCVDRRSDRPDVTNDVRADGKLMPARRAANGRIEDFHGSRVKLVLDGCGTEQRPEGVAESSGVRE